MPIEHGRQAQINSLGQQSLCSSSFVIPGATGENPTPKNVETSAYRGPIASTPGRFETRTKGVVLYLHYQFLTIGNIHTTPYQDVNYLESQGCLHVPNPSILEVFLRSYFMHVHVFLPLIDEGDFWDMYFGSPNTTDPPKTTVSLLVLQAMIFSASNFVPLPILQELGYHDVSTARTELYRKTKLLFDLEIESTHLPLAQSALLLMGWVPNSPSNTSPVPWRTWLNQALYHAKLISAHRHGAIGEAMTWAHSTEKPPAATLRRLWWCCIILDRISPLCTRFRLQITPEIFDFETCVPLGFSDLQGEIYRSKVFAPATKRRLIEIFTKFMDLLMILTEVLPIAFPFEAKLEASPGSTKDEEDTILTCREQLANWYEAVNTDFPAVTGHQPYQEASVVDPINSAVLYTNLMYIYYYTSCITLFNREIFSQVSQEAIESSEICREITRCVLGITECVGALTQYDLMMYLPVTVLACLATPLALYVVTARLSSLDRELALSYIDGQSDIDLVSDRSKLDVLIEAVDSFSPKYTLAAQWVKETAKHAANLAQSYNRVLSLSGEEAMRDWVHMLMRHPKEYLGLTWTVDLCISKTKLPERHDFPIHLRKMLEKLN
ncbi:fungal-specific transcription factor domain-containing protein [Stachybotrys elegans]|uniref:Fungal-specific transcription factor domain-containing protein n=1 Tax=Stachybotrys elegans TaxID=80388 RepID=A0A8K0SK78_9HYPO|nr:fungal-specific transcription factor domain-containing protein [Stachybotrys elegans]